MDVFLVEDDASAIGLYTKFVKVLGYDLAGVATDGLEAVELYSSFSSKPDIVLMDNYLPIMTGIDVAKQLAVNDKSVKIILMSGNREVALLAENAGFPFLSKPFTIKELEKTLKSAMDLVPNRK